MENTIRNIIVIGAGLHFRERYYPVLLQSGKNGQLRICLVMDMASERERILAFFSNKDMVPEQFVFLPEHCRHDMPPDEVDLFFPEHTARETIHGVLICTEPKAHKTYALWAIRKGLHVFCDKPLTAFNNALQPDSLLSDFHDIKEALASRPVNFVLSCERRAHAGYEYVKTFLSGLIKKCRVPVTFVDIHFGGGMWNMPDEFFYRENHPYKYGYGVLLHSGYHYIDLLFSILSLNKALYPDLRFSTMKSVVWRPADHLAVINNDCYKNLLDTDRFAPFFENECTSTLREFGETDIIIIGDFKSSEQTVAQFSVKLMETSVCNRNWHQLPDNSYMHNGRLRQEQVVIHVGPLCSIHISSHSLSKQKPAGNMEHFSIEIISNAGITGQPAYTKIDRKDISAMFPELPLHSGMNVSARQWQLKDFLQGGDGKSPLSSHQGPVEFISELYNQLKFYGTEVE